MEKMNIDDFYAGWDITMRKKNTAESERYLESSLRTAETLCDVAAITAVCNEMGGFYRAVGKLKEAGAVYDRVIENLRAMRQENSENYGVARLNQGNVYIARGDYDKALSIYEEARDILESCNMAEDYRMAALCNNISTIYRQKGMLNEAENAAMRALDIIGKLPNAHSELATSHISLGEVLIKKGDYIQARKQLGIAMEIFERETKGSDTHMAAARAAMGELEYREGNYRDAETQYSCALALIERDFGRTAYYKMIEENLNKVRREIR